jgi:hypothetical protein
MSLLYNSIPFVKYFLKKVANSHKKQLFLDKTRTDDETRRECWDAVIPAFPPSHWKPLEGRGDLSIDLNQVFESLM